MLISLCLTPRICISSVKAVTSLSATLIHTRANSDQHSVISIKEKRISLKSLMPSVQSNERDLGK